MLKRRLVLLTIPLVLACEDQAPIPVAVVDITPSPATVVAGQKVQLSATPKDAQGTALLDRTVTWISNNPAVAIVSATGQVSGMLAGNAIITATADNISGSTVVTVTPAPLVVLNVTPTPLSLFVGRTQQLSVGMIDATGQQTTRPITFTSSNNAAATVSSTGLVTAVAPGTATITATSEGKTATVAVTVSLVPVASITLTPTSATIPAGTQQQFTATLRDSAGVILTGRTIAWTSSSPSVAAVSLVGLVAGLSAGTTTITASSGGQFASARVTVTAPAVTFN
jgi:trimeric autotransporter adhesin